MSLYEPEQIGTYLADVFTDATLVGLLPGGVHENDTADGSASPGATKTRTETPYLIYAALAGEDTQGAGGTVLWGVVDYAIQVFYRPGGEEDARAALRRVQELLEGQETEVAASGGIDAHGIVVRAAGVLPRLRDTEAGGRLIYSEGRRWRITLYRAEE